MIAYNAAGELLFLHQRCILRGCRLSLGILWDCMCLFRHRKFVIGVARLIKFYVRGQVMWAMRTSIVVFVATSSAKTQRLGDFRKRFMLLIVARIKERGDMIIRLSR